jgi:ABC-type polysaccharide/polyol phosphate transport system ATPase subunit
MSILSVENASLRFPLMLDSAKSLRAVLASALSNRKRLEITPTYVDALSGISLDLNEGTRLGVIGPNGAGKSTLLRLMAGIYAPTSGRVKRSGKTLTMFDLSYGMDEEADGYENIEIAGTVLGMSLAEVQKIKQEIVEFSELGDAMSRPIKTYSAGMRVRMAFGLVSSLNSDILLIDEIIGVGDSRFMKKASNRIQRQAEATKVFVLASHAEGVLRDFCTTGIVMSAGKIRFHGEINDAIAFYNASQI